MSYGEDDVSIGESRAALVCAAGKVVSCVCHVCRVFFFDASTTIDDDGTSHPPHRNWVERPRPLAKANIPDCKAPIGAVR